MKNALLPALSILLIGAMLQGCAGVLVGGTAATVSAAHDRRTFGVYIEDQGIEFKAMEKLAAEPEIKLAGESQPDDPEMQLAGDFETEVNSRINVTSYNMVVLMTGQTASHALKTRAQQLVESVDRVRRVVNELEVGSTASLSEITQSAALVAEIKFKLTNIEIPDFDTLRVKVIVDRGNVYLMGLLTQAEADAVTDLVRHINGVNRVVKIFEYF